MNTNLYRQILPEELWTSCLVCLLFFVSTTTKAQTKIDSLLQVVRASKNDSSRVNNLVSLSREYNRTGNYSKAIATSREGLALAQRANFIRGISVNLSNLGTGHEMLSNHDSALFYHFKALELRQRMGDKKGEAVSLTNVGRCLVLKGKYAEAMRYHFKALKIKEETGNKKGAADSYNHIGIVYYYMGDLANALKHYTTALEIKKTTNDVQGISECLGNIGIVQYELKNYDASLKIQQEAFELRKKSGDIRGQANALQNMCIVYSAQKKYVKAFEAYAECEKLFEQTGNLHDQVTVLASMGSLHKSLGNQSEAEKYFSKGLLLARKIRYMHYVKQLTQDLSAVYANTNRYEKALAFYKEHVLVRDSMFNEENTKKTVQMQMQYEFDKKSAADSVKNAEAKKIDEISHQSQIRNQKLYTYAGLVGFAVMIIVAVISLIAFRNKKKANFEIAKQKMIVEMKQKEVLDSIYYARKIQRALITNEKYMARALIELRSKKN